jgi:SAM-dependent methyltransferase
MSPTRQALFPSRFLRSALRVLAIGTLFLAVAAAAFQVCRPLLRGSRTWLIASNVGHDYLRRLGLRKDQIGQSEFKEPPLTKIPAQIAHVQSVYDLYRKYSGIDAADLAGKRIFELGPGLTLGVPLLFVADGAAHVTGVDKFVPLQRSSYYQRFYVDLRNRLRPDQRQRYDRALNVQDLALNPRVLHFVYGRELPGLVDELGPESYDLVVSNAVLEEIYDINPVLQAQARLLRPGGSMVHEIDLGDYGMFAKHGFDGLEFLTVPEWVYRLMVESSGQPARRTLSFYRDAFTRMGYSTQVFVTHILYHTDPMPEPKTEIREGVDYTAADVQQLSAIRPRLQPQFRSLPDSELLAQSIILVARKPQ